MLFLGPGVCRKILRSPTDEHKYAPHPRIFSHGGWDQMDASIAFMGTTKFRVCQLDIMIIFLVFLV